MRRICIKFLLFFLLLIAGALQFVSADNLAADTADYSVPVSAADTAAETTVAEVKTEKKDPLIASIYVFAGGGLWFQEKYGNGRPPDYYLPLCNVGGALSLYQCRMHEVRLFTGYEYVSLTKSSKWGRIDTHWFMVDLNYKFNALVFGAKCQVLLDARQQGVLPHEMAGLRTDCFNKVACNAYFGLSYFNVEVFMGFYIVPLLNKKQVAINTLYTEFIVPASFSMRFNIPVFTTGRRKILFDIY